MPRLVLRSAEISDIDALVALINRAFVAESPYIEGERINGEAVREMWPRGTFLLGDLNGKLVAYIFIEPRGERAHLGLVSVEPEQQGAGLGSELMAGVEAQCRAAGFREMELRFINHRTELERLYRRMGFVPSGLIEAATAHRVKMPLHFVQMVKQL